MLKEIVTNEIFEMGRDEKLIYKRLDTAIMNIEKAVDLSKKLKDHSRLKKILDKLGSDLYEEMEFIGRGEYS